MESRDSSQKFLKLGDKAVIRLNRIISSFCIRMELRVGSRYRLGRKIGSGSFGDIYLGKILKFSLFGFSSSRNWKRMNHLTRISIYYLGKNT